MALLDHSPADAWCENMKNWEEHNLKKRLIEHKRKVVGLRQILKQKYKKVPVNGRSLEEIGKECYLVTKLSEIPGQGAPDIPGVVLIGMRGSKRRSVAKRLKEIFDIVHVDMEELITGALRLQNKTGGELCRLKASGASIYFKTILQILKNRLLQSDCMSRGWVLTGFPRNLGDFVALDNFDTPPNKIVFLLTDKDKALRNLQNRRINTYNGKIMNKTEIKKNPNENEQEYVSHPRDLIENITAEQEEYLTNIKDMLDYCGENCTILAASVGELELAEMVSALIMHPGPIAPARSLKPVENIDEEQDKNNTDQVQALDTSRGKHQKTESYMKLEMELLADSSGCTYEI